MTDALDRLTMSQFVELLCGDLSVLSPGDSEEAEAAAVRGRLIYRYAELSDPAAAARHVGAAGQRIKRQAELALLTMCSNLIEVGEHGMARSLLIDYGVGRPSADPGRLKADVGSMIMRLKRDIEVEDTDSSRPQAPDEIRVGYQRQCASLMSHFRFQIDMSSMSASQFACLVRQASVEARAMEAEMRKRR